MKILNKLALSLTALGSVSTLICGFSIASKPVIEASSIQFHAALGVLSMLLGFMTIAVFVVQQKKKA